MRTFRNLTVGDTLFKLDKNLGRFLDDEDEYGNQYTHSIIQEIKLESIRSSKDNKEFRIFNEEVRMNYKDLDLSQYETRNHLYFSDRKEYHDIIRERVVAKIKEEEESILEYKLSTEGRIRDLRKQYYYSLNNLATSNALELINPPNIFNSL